MSDKPASSPSAPLFYIVNLLHPRKPQLHLMTCPFKLQGILSGELVSCLLLI